MVAPQHANSDRANGVFPSKTHKTPSDPQRETDKCLSSFDLIIAIVAVARSGSSDSK